LFLRLNVLWLQGSAILLCLLSSCGATLLFSVQYVMAKPKRTWVGGMESGECVCVCVGGGG